jgi:hypothetical protein
MSGSETIVHLFMWGIVLLFYFVPTAISLVREKRNSLAIFALNLFLGWTLVGWVAALVWALMAEAAPRPVSPHPQPDRP